MSSIDFTELIPRQERIWDAALARLGEYTDPLAAADEEEGVVQRAAFRLYSLWASETTERQAGVTSTELQQRHIAALEALCQAVLRYDALVTLAGCCLVEEIQTLQAPRPIKGFTGAMHVVHRDGRLFITDTDPNDGARAREAT